MPPGDPRVHLNSEVTGIEYNCDAVIVTTRDGQLYKVSKTPTVGPEVGPISACCCRIPTGPHGPACVLPANLTAFSLKATEVISTLPLGVLQRNHWPRAVQSFRRHSVYFIRDSPHKISLSRVKKQSFWSKLRARGSHHFRVRPFSTKSFVSLTETTIYQAASEGLGDSWLSVKVTGLAQNLGQLEAVHRDLNSKSWASLKLLGQPCNFYALGTTARSSRPPCRRSRSMRSSRRVRSHLTNCPSHDVSITSHASTL